MANHRQARVQAALDLLDEVTADPSDVVDPQDPPESEANPAEATHTETTALIKSMRDMKETFADLATALRERALSKGSAGDEADDDDEPDDDNDDEPPGPGYADLQMSADYADVTDLLDDMGKSHQAQLDSHRALHKRVRQLEKAVQKAVAGDQTTERLEGLETLLLAQSQVLAKAAKAVTTLTERLDQIPEPSALGHLRLAADPSRVGPTPQPGTRPLRRGQRRAMDARTLRMTKAVDGGRLAGVADDKAEKRLLAKALQRNVINEAESRLWSEFGRFSQDDHHNRHLIEAVEALA